jgi:hypothetical protein
VTEDYYNIPVLKQLFNSVGAIPIPDLTKNSKDLDTSAIVKNIREALENDRNILLYPQ